MPRAPLAPCLASLLLAAPAIAFADEPAPQGEAVQVAVVPAYSVAPPPASPGLAAPGAAPLYVPADQPAATADLVGIDRRVRDDAVAERSYLAPTALVAPRGTTTFTAQAPLLPGAMVRIDRAFSDRLSLGVGAIGVLADDDLAGIGVLNGKYQLWHGRRAALAATLSLVTVPEDDDDNVTAVLPGLAASLCTDDACRTLVSGHVTAVANVDDEVLPITGGISIAHGLRRQLIAELHTTTVDDQRIFGGFIGGRFVGQRFAFDAGLGFGGGVEQGMTTDCIDICESSSSGVDVGAIPFFALSTRL